MPFRAALNSLKSKWDDIQKENSAQRPQGGPPPAVPHTTHSSTPNPTIYWQPHFDPAIPVATDWDHKQGNNNGWGNAELENYTSSPANSFHTPDHKLVLRAISTPQSADPAQKYTSARLVSRQRLSRPRGCLTAILSSPCAAGIWPAFWMLPAEPFAWPYDGEVDVAETWNGDGNNKSCLHWGFFTAADAQKHRTVGTDVPGMREGRGVKYEFAWEQGEDVGGKGGGGRMVWWIDGRAVMRATIPAGMRPFREWTILLNVAMGGNVCAGKVPGEGSYDFVVHELRLSGDPDGGWDRFGGDWGRTREGNPM